MSSKELAAEAMREMFCAKDKAKTLGKIRESLEEALDMEAAEQLVVDIGEDMDKQLKENGLTWTPGERILWAVREAFILGSLDMAQKTMVAIDMMMEAFEKDARANGGDTDAL